MVEYIDRAAVVNGIWKALYSYEDEMEAKFMADPELDVSQWFFHRIFVQTMNSIDLQVILDAPAADVVPAVRCKDCRFARFGPNWISCENFNGLCTTALGLEDFCSHGERSQQDGKL